MYSIHRKLYQVCRCITVHSGAALWKLAKGEFPGRHASDYISTRDAAKVGRSSQRPRIPPNTTHHCIKLFVDLVIDSLPCLEALTLAISHSTWFQIVVKGVRPTELNLNTVVRAVHALNCTEVDTLLLCGSVCRDDIQSQVSLCKLLQPSNLGLIGCCRVAPLLQAVNHLNSLILVSSAIYELTQTRCRIRALTAVTDVSSSQHHLATCLLNLRQWLQYLSLQSSKLTDMPLEAVAKCRNLKVVSFVQSPREDYGTTFSGPMQMASNVFEALSHLTQLEYFEWAQTINLRTVDLLALHKLLLDSLPCLNHWHMGLSFLLLSTTDLDGDTFAPLSPLLLALLKDKVGDESCTTYRFGLENRVVYSWLDSLRPSVCFRIAKPELFYKKNVQLTHMYL